MAVEVDVLDDAVTGLPLFGVSTSVALPVSLSILALGHSSTGAREYRIVPGLIEYMYVQMC